jgi:hypothetical protein
MSFGLEWGCLYDVSMTAFCEEKGMQQVEWNVQQVEKNVQQVKLHGDMSLFSFNK